MDKPTGSVDNITTECSVYALGGGENVQHLSTCMGQSHILTDKVDIMYTHSTS